MALCKVKVKSRAGKLSMSVSSSVTAIHKTAEHPYSSAHIYMIKKRGGGEGGRKSRSDNANRVH